MFNRKSLGVEISPSGVTCALVGGTAAAPRLERVSCSALAPGCVRLSLREPNITDPPAFVAKLKDAYNTLLYPGSRLSLTLPDAVGRILLLDVEGRFKSRDEALDIIRWKLKKQMPFDLADSHLDYQQVRVRPNGDMSLLVALVSRTVIGQYEALLVETGLAPARIDFNIFNLCRTFEQRLTQLDEGALVAFYNGMLGIMVFADGVPEFIRIKDLSGCAPTDNRVCLEINSSFLVHRERFPERVPRQVACIVPPELCRDFCAMVADITACEPLMLETKSVVTPADSAPADQQTLYPFTAAIGAALRNL
ncbi:MAG TPA: hypothetical protein VIH45_01255 [Desulfuromonadaceae bacterium]